MIKRAVGDSIWMIPQPDHAAVSGYLAAHWGNDKFTPPGLYSFAPKSAEIRAEVVHAIAHHDNGWWEWETEPELDPADGLPLDLTRTSLRRGIERWRMGVLRFSSWRPYTSLLISAHARWLHLQQIDPKTDPSFRHPIFQFVRWSPLSGGDLELATEFVEESEDYEAALSENLRENPVFGSAVDPAMLRPHVRLLQITDALSLFFCFGGEGELELTHAPRQGWEDRTSIRIAPLGEGRYSCIPYPFDLDPLPVSLIARVAQIPCPRPEQFGPWWHSMPPRELRFELSSES